MALRNLLSSEGWQIVKSENAKEITRIEEELFKISDNDVRYTSHDVNRIVRQHLLDLNVMPERLLSLHGSTETDTTPLS